LEMTIMFIAILISSTSTMHEGHIRAEVIGGKERPFDI